MLSSFLKKYRKPIDIVGIVSYNANITTKPTNKVGNGRLVMNNLFERLLRQNFRFGRMCFCC